MLYCAVQVYSAMADSLGAAWRDLNSVLEQRKQLLDQNFAWQVSTAPLNLYCTGMCRASWSSSEGRRPCWSS